MTDNDSADDSSAGYTAGSGEVARGPASTEEVLAELAGQVTALNGRVNSLAAPANPANPANPAGPGGPGPVDSRIRNDRFRFERTDRDSAATAQQELAAWVLWLVVTYNLHDTVPPCWAGHDGLAEEMAGLYLGWCGAWSGKDARPDAVLIWHEQLARLKSRVGDWGRGEQCGGAPRCQVDLDLRGKLLRRWIAHQPADDGENRLNRTQRTDSAPIPIREPQPTNRSAAPASRGGT